MESNISIQLDRISVTKDNGFNGNKTVLVDLLEEQVKYLTKERDDIMKSKQEVVQEMMEQQLQIEQIAQNVVNKEKEDELIYMENDDLYDELDRLQEQKLSQDQEI